AAAAQLRLRPIRDERAAVARPPPAARGRGDVRGVARWLQASAAKPPTRGRQTALPSVAPGPWLRLSALVAAGGAVLAVVSGAAGLGTAHRLLAALVVPPLAALVVSAWFAHRRLVAP